MTIFLFILLGLCTLFLLALHFGFRAPRIRENKTPADFGIPFKQTSIPTVSGKKLFGWFLNVDSSAEIIIILHGWGGNAELMLPLALPFYRAGINVLLIDSRNHGNSDSDTFSSLPRFAEDLGAAIDWVKKHHPEQAKKIALLGHSVGASAVIFEASKRDDIQAVISISAFAHPEWLMQRFLQGLQWKTLRLPRLMIDFIIKYIQWIIGHTFTSIAPLHTICKIKAPILLVHGKEDSTVPVEDARAIIKNCPEPNIELLEIDDAGHESVDKIEEHAAQLVQFLKQSF